MESLPEGLSPKTKQLLLQTQGDRVGLLDAVAGLTPEQFDYRPTPDAWSVGEVLHHLALAHEATAKLMSVFLRGGKEEGCPEDLHPNESVLHSIDDVVGRRADDTKVVAPELVTPKSYAPFEESLTRLDVSRKRLVDTVAALSKLDLTQLTFKHPFFGELDAYQWLLVAGWHERRHTGQIGRIKTSPCFPGGDGHQP